MPASIVGARPGCERFLHPVGAVLVSLQPWNALTEPVIGLAIHVHRALGPGLLESVYAACLAHELRKAGTPFVAQRPLPVQYDGVQVDCGYRLDLVVGGQLIVEVKSVQALAPIHTAQILTYLKLTGCPIRMLVNFNVPLLKNGIKRVINPHPREGIPVPDMPREGQEPDSSKAVTTKGKN